MKLLLDIGNSQVFGGLMREGEIVLRFRRTSQMGSSSDELGIFLRSVLRENGYRHEDVEQIAVCTVVPELLHSLKNCCSKYFGRQPFVLQAGVKTGLKIKYHNPQDVGTDRIANAIAASQLYPQKNLIIVDFGTANTFCAVSANREYLGGVITAGLKISMSALESRTAKLPSVEILMPDSCVGRSTVESIQSGLYWGTVGQIREITNRITKETFSGAAPMVIGTGGFASLFDQVNIFDLEDPDLVLKGLNFALEMNL